jgi:hypothetical protein
MVVLELMRDTKAIKVVEKLLLAIAYLSITLLRDDPLPAHHFWRLFSSVENNLLEQELEHGIKRFLFEAKAADFLSKLKEVKAFKLCKKASWVFQLVVVNQELVNFFVLCFKVDKKEN